MYFLSSFSLLLVHHSLIASYGSTGTVHALAACSPSSFEIFFKLRCMILTPLTFPTVSNPAWFLISRHVRSSVSPSCATLWSCRVSSAVIAARVRGEEKAAFASKNSCSDCVKSPSSLLFFHAVLKSTACCTPTLLRGWSKFSIFPICLSLWPWFHVLSPCLMKKTSRVRLAWALTRLTCTEQFLHLETSKLTGVDVTLLTGTTTWP
mmetsp:Transcript_38238/g.75281  ORF Transcript_38238/g.75281 Transcript_38238/m.75281 type:complete len:207 (+) Transcript_38238:371-991(+)